MSESWWQRGTVYQIYPRSFMDSGGDGVGDLNGITAKLPYLQDLGVDAVWISPFYPSPMADFGYDVTDHTAVDPLFGTLTDFYKLVAEAHRRDLRILVDFVPNHTSDRHPWFVDARSTKDSLRRDWYLWADPRPGGGPPNNWRSVFGGPAWTLDEPTGQYYYHAYLPEQPDVNWRNPEVQQAQSDVMRFWLDRGVDGFRVDACRQLIKDDQLRDNPPNPAYHPGLPPYDALLPVYSADRPETPGVLAELRRVLDEHHPDGLLIAEVYAPVERLMRYYLGAHLPSNMHLISVPYEADSIAALIARYEAALPPDAWPNWVLGNHDRSRIATRVGPAQARVAAMLLLTLRGTPILYYGDEIGLPDVPVPPDLVQDPFERRVPGIGVGRDPARAPMRWSPAPNAGFCPPHATPWLPVPDGAEWPNVHAQQDDPGSVLALYRDLIALRRCEPALSTGDFTLLGAEAGVLSYLRRNHDRTIMVGLNLTAAPRDLPATGTIMLGTRPGRVGERLTGMVRLRANEGVLVIP
ncbi:MAG TPA: alpha-amylase family glycosyl hydrolase [Actinophytocola sp.]|jgi:alpha-glucosidase|uniref:alpha-amylase family glycosyl hydrolase n=1 Tax=Actinophytocola sp. TaxID=1872138 RepID=UPI002E04E3B0|nr:alpha-amylase family glycosyl hydrolase [Actinophytocola sp.]